MWEYLHSVEMARQYEAGLAGSPVLAAEKVFLARHLPAAGLILDLGCGTGRQTRALRNPSRTVIGVDLSTAMLAEAAGQGAAPLVRTNLVGLAALRDHCADAALCLFGTLGLIHPAAARQQVVAAARRVLVPGGLLILHVHNRHAALLRPGQRWWWLTDSLQPWSSQAGDWPMPPHQGLARLTMHLFSRGEVARLLGKAGFRLVDVLPLGFGPDGGVTARWWLANWRAHGFLIAARA